VAQFGDVMAHLERCGGSIWGCDGSVGVMW
jgi:hypothetical protein